VTFPHPVFEDGVGAGFRASDRQREHAGAGEPQGSRSNASKTREHGKKDNPRVLCDSERVGIQQ
jgi:hypothetical protein